MKGQGMLISAFLFALIIAIFAVINVESVQVNFLFAKATMPLILVILVSTLLGGLTVGLFGMIRIYRLQKTVKTLEKKNADPRDGVAPFDSSLAEGQAVKDGKAGSRGHEAESQTVAKSNGEAGQAGKADGAGGEADGGGGGADGGGAV